MEIALDRNETRRKIFYVLIAAIVFAALIAIIGVLAGSLGSAGGKALLTSGTIVVYGILGLASTVGGSEERRVSRLVSLNAVLAALGVLSALLIIWIDYESETLWKGQACLFVWVFATAHACILQGTRRTTDSKLVARTVSVTIGLVALVALFINISILSGDDRGGIFYQLMIVAIVLDIAGNLLVPMLRKAQRRAVVATASPTAFPAMTNGTSLDSNSPNVRSTPNETGILTKFCTQCGSQVPATARFCPECGVRRNPDEAEAVPTSDAA